MRASRRQARKFLGYGLAMQGIGVAATAMHCPISNCPTRRADGLPRGREHSIFGSSVRDAPAEPVHRPRSRQELGAVHAPGRVTMSGMEHANEQSASSSASHLQRRISLGTSFQTSFGKLGRLKGPLISGRYSFGKKRANPPNQAKIHGVLMPQSALFFGTQCRACCRSHRTRMHSCKRAGTVVQHCHLQTSTADSACSSAD